MSWHFLKIFFKISQWKVCFGHHWAGYQECQQHYHVGFKHPKHDSLINIAFLSAEHQQRQEGEDEEQPELKFVATVVNTTAKFWGLPDCAVRKYEDFLFTLKLCQQITLRMTELGDCSSTACESTKNEFMYSPGSWATDECRGQIV